MPQLAGAAAAWAVTAWTSAVTVVNTAMVAAAGAALPGLSFGAQLAVANFATKAVVFGGLAAASAALMRPNIPSSGTSLDFKPDPKAPIRGAMGYTALGGNKVFQATWGYKRVAMSLGVALSLGPIDQVPRFEADGATVTFSGPQNEATGFYAADMWQRTTLGLPGDAALLPPTGLKYGNPGLTGWGTQHAAPQVSFSFWTMVLAKNPEDRDVFTNGVPDPRWIGRWMKVWQPRYDSTYPGGNGPQRRDDWRTWGWSENPYDHGLAWVRGHYKLNPDGSIDRSKRIAGIGAPDAAIDIPAFVEGANIADANGWTISGEWSTSDGKFQTLLAMLQAGGGEPISRGAQISVMVNAPRVATYTYTRDDLIGQAEIRPLTPRRERKNTIVPRYKSEANGWQYVPAGEVTSSVYRDEDRGEPRSLEIEYTHVRDAKQAGQLAAYDLANLREGLTATLPSKVHLMHVHPGDCITVDVPELALAGQKFVVRRATVNHQAASVTLELRSESDGKHAWALGQAAQPAPSPSLSAVDPKYVPPPAPEDWTAVPKPPGEGGVSQPIVIIELPIETTDIIAVIIKHGPGAAGPWTDGYEGSPRTDGRYEVAGLTPGQTYCFSIQYVAKNGAKSEPDIKCGIVAGDLIAGDTTHLNGEPVQDILDKLTSTADLTAANAAAVADLDGRVDDTITAAEAAIAAGEAANLAVLKAGEAGDAAEASNTAAGIATTKADEAGASATAANAEKLAAEAARDTADQKAQASVLAAAQAEAFAGDAGDWAAASEGAAVQAAASAGEGLAYRNAAVDARDGAVAASQSAGVSASTAQASSVSAANSAGVAQAASANASADAASAQISANLAAQVGQGAGYHKNPSWLDWTTGSLPPNSVLWTAATTSARNTASARYGACLEVNSADGSNSGVQLLVGRFVTPGPVAHVVVEYEVLLQGGSFRRSGLQASIQDGGSDRNAIVHLFDEHGVGVAGQTYTGAKLIKLPVAAASPNGMRLYLFNNFADLAGGTSGGKNLRWQRVNVRPASSAEIEAGRVQQVEGQLAIVGAVAADAADRLASVRFDVTGGAGGDPFDISLKAGPNGSDASITATRVRLRNIVNGQAIDVLTIENGASKFTGNVAIMGGTMNINNRFMVALDGTMTVRSSTGTSRMEMTNAALKAFNAGVKRAQFGDLTA